MRRDIHLLSSHLPFSRGVGYSHSPGLNTWNLQIKVKFRFLANNSELKFELSRLNTQEKTANKSIPLEKLPYSRWSTLGIKLIEPFKKDDSVNRPCCGEVRSANRCFQVFQLDTIALCSVFMPCVDGEVIYTSLKIRLRTLDSNYEHRGV